MPLVSPGPFAINLLQDFAVTLPIAGLNLSQYPGPASQGRISLPLKLPAVDAVVLVPS